MLNKNKENIKQLRIAHSELFYLTFYRNTVIIMKIVNNK